MKFFLSPIFALLLIVAPVLVPNSATLWAGESVEFRRALVMNATSADPRGKIKKLVDDLQAKGFVVTHLTNAAKDGWPAYEKFLRRIPEGGVNVLYYYGPLDAVIQSEKKLSNLRLGGVKKIPMVKTPPDPKDRRKNTPRPPPLDIAPLKDRLNQNAARLNLAVFDFTEIIDQSKSDLSANKLEASVLGPVRTMIGPRIFAAANKPGKTRLVDSVMKILGGGNQFQDKSLVSYFAAPKQSVFSFKHTPGKVISSPDKLIQGKKAGDHWIDPNGMVFVWCPAGKFTMGDKQFFDASPVEVTISKGYWIGKYELTRASGNLMRLSSSSHFGREVHLPFYGPDCSTIADALKRWRAHLKKMGMSTPGWNYDIPTEAEWEYAARAGKTNPDAVDPVALAKYGNFADRTLFENPRETPFIYAHRTADDGYGHDLAPIGSYKPNAWGIHDMFGNIAEVVCTKYTKTLTGGVDPNLLEAQGRNLPRYVIRGGAWCSPAIYLHPAHRSLMANAGTLVPYSGVRLIIRNGEHRALSHNDLRELAKTKSKKK